MDLAPRTLNQKTLFSMFVRILCSGVYLFAITLLLRDYAAVEWGLYLIYFGQIDVYDIVILLFFTVIAASALPSHISSPSSMMLAFAYFFIIMPAAVCLVAMDTVGGANRYLTLLAILIGFCAAVFITQHKSSDEAEAEACDDRRREAHPFLIPILIGIAILLLIYLFIRFGSIMSFATLDTLYQQRELGGAENFFDGYAQTYSQYVLSTGLLAFGLFRKNLICIILGLVGSITNFAITAEKAGAIYPLFIIILFIALKQPYKIFTSVSFVMISLSVITIFVTYTWYSSSVSEFFAWYLGIRTILIPGSFVVNYSDFFFDHGYTYFSHFRGLNLFVPIPSHYVSDPRWPQIGLILGEDLIGFPNLNANANFIATDGVASFGAIGIVLAFLGFSVVLRILDQLGRGVPKALLLPLLLSIALTLTNGSVLTVLTSFGGLFWMVVLRFGFRPVGQASANGSGSHQEYSAEARGGQI